MSRVRRILIILVGLLIVLALGLAAFGLVTVRRSFPRVEGELRLAGLDAPVEIIRDDFGIPQIYAQTAHDLFFAQGYVHAQDRFWQMDAWRHVGSGRTAEMFGESQVGTDKFLRSLGWARVAEQELALADPQSLAVLQAYAEGVNAYLTDHQGSALSLEYAILGLLTPEYEPEPWQPLHTLTFVKLMAWDLGRSKLDGIIQRAILLKTLTPDQLAEILPAYPDDHPVIVNHPHLTAQGEAAPQQAAAPLLDVSPALAALADQLATVDASVGFDGLGAGSNSWVIGGEHTDTGLPYLANDPHLSSQMPSIWYQIGLHCAPKGLDCPYDVTGFSFASAPGVVIGHNERIAWGFTNLGPDVVDLYIEKINPQNPNQYEVNGQWVDMEIVEETIQTGGAEAVPFTVRRTRHGPIISETFGPLEDFASQAGGVELPGQFALALRWTALDPGFTYRAILEFNRAQNWEEFREAAKDFSYPSQNLIYADVDGNIGYQSPGMIPLRNPGHRAELPVPGWTDDYEWQGFIAFEELPFAFNPPEGYLVTANNAVVGAEYPHFLTGVWDYGYRAQRIVEMIETAPRPITFEAVQEMQGDNKDLNAVTLVPLLAQLPLDDPFLAEARALLLDWDYQDHMDSAPAALFQVFWKHLLADTFRDDLPEGYWPVGDSRWFEVVRRLVETPQSPWWDNRDTPQIEDRDQIFRQALQGAVDELDASLGEVPERWRWGDLHTLIFRNQTLGVSGVGPVEALLNRGPYRTSGSSSVVNNTRWDASAESYEVGTLPSMRMVVDLSNLANSAAIHPTGQSGHAYHPHYVDMADLWRLIGYRPMLWLRDDIEANAAAVLRLVPQ